MHLSVLLTAALTASASAVAQHRRQLSPPGDAVVPVAPAVVEGPPNNAVVPIDYGRAAPLSSVASEVAGATSAPPAASSIVPSLVAALPSAAASAVEKLPSSVASDVASGVAGVASKAAHVASSVAAVATSALPSDVAAVVSGVAAVATSVLSSNYFPHPYPESTLSTVSSPYKNATTATMASSTTTTTSSGTTASSAAATASGFSGGLTDPTLDKPCFNSSCSNPDSNMNYAVTIPVDDKSKTYTGSGAAVKVGSFGALVGAVVAGIVLL